MIQPLRNTHRRLFWALLVLLPALFLSGLAFRHSWPSAKEKQTLVVRPQSSGARP